MNIYELEKLMNIDGGLDATRFNRNRLDSHKIDNFMRALEALKEINDPNMSSHAWKHWLRALPALIEELEEVK